MRIKWKKPRNSLPGHWKSDDGRFEIKPFFDWCRESRPDFYRIYDHRDQPNVIAACKTETSTAWTVREAKQRCLDLI